MHVRRGLLSCLMAPGPGAFTFGTNQGYPTLPSTGFDRPRNGFLSTISIGFIIQRARLLRIIGLGMPAWFFWKTPPRGDAIFAATGELRSILRQLNLTLNGAKSVTRPDSTTEQYTGLQVVSLCDTRQCTQASPGTAVLAVAAEAVADYTDPRRRVGIRRRPSR